MCSTCGPKTRNCSMDKKLEEVVTKLTEGQTSDPVRTHFGYQIAQVEKVFAAENRSLVDAKKEIAGLGAATAD